MNDQIVIDGLEIHAHIGVPEPERQNPQRLTVTLTIEPNVPFEKVADRIERTVDYAAVCARVQARAVGSRWQLIESLGVDLAQDVLEQFAVRSVEVELRKFILPDTSYVAVRLRRSRVQ